MNLDVAQLRQRASGTFAGFTSGQKTILAIAVAAVVVGGFMFTKWAGAPSYAPLFSNLEASDAAAVTVINEPGKTLGSGQVQAVVHLVASSVEGLDPKQVTVTDDSGRVLASPDTDGMGAATVDANTDKQRAFEDGLATELEALLSPVVGAGKAVVRVSADLDFDQVERTSETFDPERTAVVNESTTTEDYTGANTGPTGVLGVDPQAVDPAGAQNTYTKEEQSRQVAVTKVNEHVREAPGSVERLSVAVLVDGNAGAVNDAEVQRLVSTAAGLRPDRGDEITVSTMAFDDTVAEAAKKEQEAAAAAAQQAETLALARTVGAVVIVLVVLALAYRSMKKAGVKRYPLAVPIDLPAEPELPAAAAQLEERTGEELAAELAELTQAPAAIEVPELVLAGNQERQVVEAQIGALIDKQPEDVAQLLRGWLGDRRS